MPELDLCIAGTFEPGNIGASSGLPPVAPTMPSTIPEITSDDEISVDESVPLVHTLAATSFVGWSIVGGADAAQFEISGSTLRWASNGTRDFDTPLDADTNNIYVVEVRATTLWLSTADQTISVTVVDIYTPTQVMINGVFVNLTGARQVMTPGTMIDETL